MNRRCFTVTLDVQAPFLFPGVNAGRYGLDKVALRDHAGNLVLPEDQLRGVVLEAAKELLGKNDTRIARFFGTHSGDALTATAGSFVPVSTRLFFSDLKATVNASQRPNSAFHRVRIDEETGAADGGQLVMLEQPTDPASVVRFKGPLVVYANDDELEFVQKLLKRVFEFPTTIGSYATIGFGRIVRSKDESVVRTTDSRQRRDIPQSERLTWSFAIDRPYLVDADRIANNVYLGKTEIPGSVLKGALAQNLHLLGYDTKAPPLSTALSKMRIGFGRYNSAEKIPFSVVHEEGSRDSKTDLCVEHPQPMDFVPVFQEDWKTEIDEAQQNTVRYDERIHTAIAHATQTANDGELFATIAIEPNNGKFQAELDLSCVDNSSREIILGVLSMGIDGVGKTNASIETLDFTVRQGSELVSPGQHNLMVVSPGLFATFEDGASAKEAYQTFWKSVLPNSSLVNFFARQDLRGGYQSRRFTLKDRKYRNWLMTLPQSVFRFDIHPHDCKRLDKIVAQGLCRSALNGEALTWENCPFVSENGFGEIYLVGASE